MAYTKILKDAPVHSRISLSEPYEIHYWTKKFGATVTELKEIIKKVGNSAEAVENELCPHDRARQKHRPVSR